MSLLIWSSGEYRVCPASPPDIAPLSFVAAVLRGGRNRCGEDEAYGEKEPLHRPLLFNSTSKANESDPESWKEKPEASPEPEPADVELDLAGAFDEERRASLAVTRLEIESEDARDPDRRARAEVVAARPVLEHAQLRSLELDRVERERFPVEDIDENLGPCREPGRTAENVEGEIAPGFGHKHIQVNRELLVGEARLCSRQLAKALEKKRMWKRRDVRRFAIVPEELHCSTDGQGPRDPVLGTHFVALGSRLAVEAFDPGLLP